MEPSENLIEQKKRRIEEIHRIEPNRAALLVIDMQRAFTDPEASLGVPDIGPVVDVIAGLVRECRERGIPVIFTEFISDPTVPTLRKDPFGPEHLAPGDGAIRGWGRPSGSCMRTSAGPESPDTTEELRPREDETVIAAHGLDKFYGTPLDMVLRSRDVRYLMMTGILADLCVLSTAFSATSREYRVTTVSDGIATIWPDIQKSVLDIMDRKLARLMTADALVKELSAAT